MQLAIPDKLNNLAIELNTNIQGVIESRHLEGFQRAYLIAKATEDLKSKLTAEYMKPIMELQGSKLGFKTDKDRDKGYPEAVVKNCLIEAVLTGVQPFGNQFNIIAENCYITKEGFGHLLSKYPGLTYEIIPELPRVNQAKDGAAIHMNIRWKINGSEWSERKIEFAIKMNSFMGVDAVIGKATRKARAWLYNTITGSEISDGEVGETPYTEVMEITQDMLRDMLDEKRELLSLPELKDANRIINDNEIKSFPKLKTLLESKKAA